MEVGMLTWNLSSWRRHLRVAARPLAFLILLAALPLVSGCLFSKRVIPGVDGRGPAPAPAISGPVLLRVGLGEQLGKQRIACTGPWRLSSGRYGDTIVDLVISDTTSVRRMSGKVAYNNDLSGGMVDWVVMSPLDPDDFMIWDGKPWRGELHAVLSPQDTTGITLINVVELESYLAGVVPREIGGGRSTDELAAIQAQAVAARTYTIAHLDGRGSRGFDVYADTRDQVYGGVDVEDSLCSAAVAATAGLVLRRDGRLVDAYYHSTCGGHTASIDDVWPTDPDPALRGVKDQRPDGRPFCADSKYAQWRQQWTWSELEAVLQYSLPAYLDAVARPGRAAWAAEAFIPSGSDASGRQPGTLLDLKVDRRTSDGRVDVLTVTTDAGRYHIRGDRTRWVLRPPKGRPSLLRSAWFDLEVDAGRGVTAVGRGWGHGIGLCQIGCLARARAGQDVRAILGHYYGGARLEPISEAATP